MSHRRGFVLRELAALVLFLTMSACVLLAMAPEPDGLPARTLENLRSISQAAHFYRLSNNNYLPLTLTYSPRGSAPRPGSSMFGWCTWSFGGKNNSPWWFSSASGSGFDVEAADRPLNSYVLPEEPFYAPPFPERLPGSHPTRLTAQAEMFRDPGDTISFQRTWPTPSPKISGYDDVGTSYLTNWAWWDQLPMSSYPQRFAEGVRRIAVGQGVNPSRFVWLTDHYGDVLWGHSNPRFRIRNGHGDINFAPLVFLDGHVTYEYITPRRLTTPTYSFLFE